MCEELIQDDIKGKIPDSVEPSVARASIQTKKRPYVQTNEEGKEVKVPRGLIKILKPKKGSDLEEGSKFVIKKRKIVAKEIDMDENKVRGSNNHNRYRFVAYDGKVTNYGDWKESNSGR